MFADIGLLTDSAPAGTSTETLMLLGLVGFGAVYFFVLRPMSRKKDPLDRPPAFASLSQQRAVERQMQSLLVELSEMSRQISAQLDTRAAKLEQLIHDADERIARLQSAQQNAVAPSFAQAPAVQQTHAALDPRHTEVYALADQGNDAGQIATQLDRPRGEVELILALRSR